MRSFFSGLLAAGLLASPIANSAMAQCLRPAEVNALDVAWLKSQMMVLALTCQQNSKYNAFIERYRPILASEDKELNGYFTRVHGRQGSKLRDDYVTQLANSQSQVGLRQGSLFCNNNMPMLDEVMSLRNASELAQYAAAKGVVQPINVDDCAGAPAPRRHGPHHPPRDAGAAPQLSGPASENDEGRRKAPFVFHRHPIPSTDCRVLAGGMPGALHPTGVLAPILTPTTRAAGGSARRTRTGAGRNRLSAGRSPRGGSAAHARPGRSVPAGCPRRSPGSR